MKITLIIIGLLSFSFAPTIAYKVLGIFPLAGKSHYILASSIMKSLAEAGHDVTIITPFTEKKTPPNYREVVIKFEEPEDDDNHNLLDFANYPAMFLLPMLATMGKDLSNGTMTNPNVTQLLESDAKFDVIIMELFHTEALIGFGQYYNAPVMGVSAFGASNYINNLVGNPAQSSVNAHPFLTFTDKMNFLERCYNLLFNTVDLLLINYFHYPMQKAVYDASFPDPKPDFDHIIKHGLSFGLLNTHFSIGSPKPLVPNMVEIGGIQVNRKPKPLPEDLQKYLDSAKDGAVYFSMGSNIESRFFPIEKRDAVLKTFAKFPKIKFLWKWEDEELPGKPDNLFIQKWFPQNDILAHPNIRCFITHGGLLGTTESIYHGVPVIGIPIFGDQSVNMAKAVSAGFGIKIEYKNLTEESLTWAVTNMLAKDNKFKPNAMDVSKRYRDQPMNPAQTLNYWLEYVVRHKGASFMKSPTQHLSFWQYLMLDVIAFFTVVTSAFIVLIQKLLRFLCCKKNVQVSKNKKQN